jgi:succinyl-diaminopimelate desuccinylase
MKAREDILKRLKTQENESMALLSELIKRPSENPPGDTRAVADFVTEYLRARGFSPEVVSPEPTMPNVIAVVEGRSGGRNMILNGHMDTFPIGSQESWSMDPFEGIVVDDRIYGKGVSDMKAGLAASLIAFCLLAEIADVWNGRLTLALVSDEETFGPWGANYLVHHYPKLRGDAVLIGEPTTPKTVRFGEKGFVWCRLRAKGRSAHSAYPHHGWNAIVTMNRLLQNLKKLEKVEWEVPEDLLKAIDKARQGTDELLGLGTTDLLSAVTVNLGTIKGGTKANLVADLCEAEVDIRIPPGVPSSKILMKVGQIAREEYGVSYELMNRSEPNYSNSEGDLFTIVTKCVSEIRGQTPMLNFSCPATDSRVFRSVGIPTAVHGPQPHNVAAADEYVNVQDYLETVCVHTLSAFDFLSMEEVR